MANRKAKAVVQTAEEPAQEALVLRWNFDNAYVRTDPAGNLKLDKEKSTEKIDGAVALVMALDRAMKNQNGSDSVYNDRGLLLL